MDNLAKALTFGGILNADEIERITVAFEVKVLKAGEHFYKPGDIADKLGFVDSGVVRVYIPGNELEEATKYFMRKNQFLMEFESFYDNNPAPSGIQAVTEARLLTINRNGWNRLTEEVPKLFLLTKMLTEAALINKIRDNEFLSFGTARQKYDEFVKRYPDLALSVPLQYIASYLQITPQSLSRIRKQTGR
ncbi:Crp/Fnr family transcriptional regulator [Mucilaginibacter sp. BJC16-A38]|uniref:Crp/Fnr family transcriptional regulator n=1 Tax=Mucilaginibacter phenanthrenivorans TaxID=1234842 RepID=UPI002157B291|nr:Crp/Fnr family transcriptional regulator [Mucilaginibacter phenanthrenivorans]MCR8558981.1 Crp/Fnr family transcriptional regulator [Mucilaginibacter phenanthrenivorans]